ncbi:hypothetical protein GCM10009007_14760 [Formosimonas limnophila]|uniref:Prepilin-type N-terminal cleavage/methylation domain-containing protein n=1 Tax=Formosimonas limnophila TaxID=1384487 RepID=A0A8J3CLQ0_9BURK|nr:prepilin-type N-terminal cleavage/methylation domain-containing protein [Formosimonas limnophila]GHA74735.1 hypothetical protein GCM10009007_14760 [Formosimonas limnophila]
MYFLRKVGYNRRVIRIYTQGVAKMNVCDFLSKLLKVRKSSAVASQAGFTLLEMLVVIAVVGVLAAIAVPRFQNSLQKAQFVEVVNAAGPYKAAVELCRQKTGSYTDCDEATNGVPPKTTNDTTTTKSNVKSVSVADGVITVTAADKFKSAGKTEDMTYVQKPADSGSAISWSVSGECVAAALCDN